MKYSGNKREDSTRSTPVDICSLLHSRTIACLLLSIVVLLIATWVSV